MSISPFLLPLPVDTNFKPLLNQGNSFFKQKNWQKAWNSYQTAFDNLWDNWAKFNNDYYWPENRFLYDERYKFIYCPIPKVASSTIRRLHLMIQNRQNDFNDNYNLWHYSHFNVSFYSLTYWKAIKILNNKSYFKFTFVRNPYSRLLSGYLNKFVRPKDKLPFFFKDVIRDVYNYKSEKIDLDKSITFEDFLRYLMRTENKKLNEHWKPQYLFLGRTKFDFIGKFENIKEDFEYIKNKLNLPYELPHNNKTKYTKTSRNAFDINWSKLTPSQLKSINQYPKYHEFYNEVLMDLVSKRYEKDVKMFGYEFI